VNLYKADTDYYNYLQYYEPKISYVENKKENRPFVGIVLCVNDKNFFAPLTSPKKKHIYMGEQEDFIKINQGRLGGINLNNMLPIPKRHLLKIEIDEIKDIKYKNIINNQVVWLNINQKKIQNKAKELYYLVTTKAATKDLIDRCCDFKLLEKKCAEYMYENEIHEDEILYYVANRDVYL